MREQKEIKSCRKQWKEQKNSCRKKFIWKAQNVGKVPNGTSGLKEEKNKKENII